MAITKYLAITLIFILGTTTLWSANKVYAGTIGDTIPTTTNLKFTEVLFSVQTQKEYYDRLYSRAMKRLAQAGIYKADPSTPQATLKLTLDPQPLRNLCDGKVLYARSLSLTEKVIIKRIPTLEIWGETWQLIQAPQVSDPVSIEQLEHDLDEYLDQFIIAYKMGNNSSKKK